MSGSPGVDRLTGGARDEVAGVIGFRRTSASRGPPSEGNNLSLYMNSDWLGGVVAKKRRGSGGRGTLVPIVVVAVLLGALAWWYVRRDDDETPPVLTMGAVSDVGTNQVKVSWLFVANDATFQSYQLQFHPADMPNQISTVGGTFDDVSKTNHTFQGLASGRAYVFRVTARSDMDDVTDTVAQTTLSDLTGGEVLGVDTDTVTVQWVTPFTTTDTTVDLVWTSTEDNDVPTVKYRIEQSADQTTWTEVVTVDTNTTEHQVTGLDSNTLYYFRVVKTNEIERYDNVVSEEQSATTLRTVAQATGWTIPFTATDTTVDLVWTDSLDNDNDVPTTNYRIEQSADQATWTVVATVEPNERTHTVTGLGGNSTYYFRVVKMNAHDGYDEVVSVPAPRTTDQTPDACIQTQMTAADGAQCHWSNDGDDILIHRYEAEWCCNEYGRNQGYRWVMAVDSEPSETVDDCIRTQNLFTQGARCRDNYGNILGPIHTVGWCCSVYGRGLGYQWTES
jgi:hypothetical protein